MVKPDKEVIKNIAENIADSQYGGYEDGYYDYIAGVIDGINYVYDEMIK